MLSLLSASCWSQQAMMQTVILTQGDLNGARRAHLLTECSQPMAIHADVVSVQESLHDGHLQGCRGGDTLALRHCAVDEQGDALCQLQPLLLLEHYQHTSNIGCPAA